MTKRILIIDDDGDDREFLREAIGEQDATITCQECQDGVQALTLLRENLGYTPDFIFLDLNMPLMNGRQCLGKIRQIPRMEEVPVIIYSTTRHLEEDTLLDMGNVRFLTKPSRLHDLRSSLADILGEDLFPFNQR
ncbi:response regulator [Chitinophaga lutea]